MIVWHNSRPDVTTFRPGPFANSTYTFRLTATNTGGNSDSVTAAATTQMATSYSTDLLAAANSQTRAAFVTDNADNEEGYQMKYAPKQPVRLWQHHRTCGKYHIVYSDGP